MRAKNSDLFGEISTFARLCRLFSVVTYLECAAAANDAADAAGYKLQQHH